MYYLLYQVDNLNTAIETAKRIFTKEKIDKQKTGQSSAIPFMEASQEKSKKKGKGVSFGAIETKETMDRHSNSIDKLTSLVNKLDMKLDKREAEYKPAVYQNRGRGCRQKQKIIIGTEIGPIAEIEVNPIIEEEDTFNITEIIDPIIELGVDQEMAVGMEMDIEGITVDKAIEEIIIDKITETKGIRIEAQVKTMVGLGPDIEVTPEITLGMGPTIEVKVGIETDVAVEMKDKVPEQNPETGIEKVGPLQDLDLVPVLIQTGIDLDALDVVNMIILQENALMHLLIKNQAQIQKT